MPEPPNPPEPSPRPAAAQTPEERLARRSAALRANLARRKQQARARAAEPEDTPPLEPPTGR
jgi:hypothetical protein